MTAAEGASAPLPLTPPVVRVRGVNHYFGTGETRSQVLFDNNLEVLPGELVILTGPSGSGKTTLLTLIGGLRTLQEGAIDVWDSELGQYRSLLGLDEQGLVQVRRLIGFIFQRHNLFESLTALQNVRMAQQLRPMGPEADDRARELLTRLGLAERTYHKPRQLSGGQRQRVAVARALINGPKLILADEPTAALDEKSGEAVIGLLRELAREQGCTSLIVTHDSRIMNAADRIVDMQRGHIASNIVVAERLFIYEGLRRCAPLAALLPQELFRIADRISIGLHPDRPATDDDVALAGAGKRQQNLELAFERHPAGAAIIRQGEVGDKFYLIRRGQVAVFVDDGDGPRKEIELGRQDFFGDRALVTDKPRNASVIAEGPVEVYTIGRETFQQARQTSIPFIQRVLAVYREDDGAL
jgi:putative ABC transport system ATP-binding protein